MKAIFTQNTDGKGFSIAGASQTALVNHAADLEDKKGEYATTGELTRAVLAVHYIAEGATGKDACKLAGISHSNGSNIYNGLFALVKGNTETAPLPVPAEIIDAIIPNGELSLNVTTDSATAKLGRKRNALIFLRVCAGHVQHGKKPNKALAALEAIDLPADGLSIDNFERVYKEWQAVWSGREPKVVDLAKRFEAAFTKVSEDGTSDEQATAAQFILDTVLPWAVATGTMTAAQVDTMREMMVANG